VAVTDYHPDPAAVAAHRGVIAEAYAVGEGEGDRLLLLVMDFITRHLLVKLLQDNGLTLQEQQVRLKAAVTWRECMHINSTPS
jgi:hypothetical protein